MNVKRGIIGQDVWSMRLCQIVQLLRLPWWLYMKLKMGFWVLELKIDDYKILTSNHFNYQSQTVSRDSADLLDYPDRWYSSGKVLFANLQFGIYYVPWSAGFICFVPWFEPRKARGLVGLNKRAAPNLFQGAIGWASGFCASRRALSSLF